MTNFEARQKGAVGKFEIWLVGKMAWEVRHNGNVVGRAENMNRAFNLAQRLNGGIRAA